MPFSLSKWYLDLLTPEGECFIAYVAELRWRGLRVHYAARLGARPGEAPLERSSLRASQGVERKDSEIRLQLPALEVRSGAWALDDRWLEEDLWSARPGDVTWTCFSSRAPARVEVEGRALEGAGYAERLELQVAPWKLPIDELAWGHAVAGEHALVWLEWRGPAPLRKLWLDGEALDATTLRIAEDLLEVELERGRLRLDLPRRPLREGTLRDNVLPGVSMLTRLIPGRWLDTEERKWQGEATLSGVLTGEGHAIHERVSFRR